MFVLLCLSSYGRTWEFGEYLRSKTFSRLRLEQALTLLVHVLFLKLPFDPQLERQTLKIKRIEERR